MEAEPTHPDRPRKNKVICFPRCLRNLARLIRCDMQRGSCHWPALAFGRNWRGSSLRRRVSSRNRIKTGPIVCSVQSIVNGEFCLEERHRGVVPCHGNVSLRAEFMRSPCLFIGPLAASKAHVHVHIPFTWPFPSSSRNHNTFEILHLCLF